MSVLYWLFFLKTDNIFIPSERLIFVWTDSETVIIWDFIFIGLGSSSQYSSLHLLSSNKIFELMISIISFCELTFSISSWGLSKVLTIFSRFCEIDFMFSSWSLSTFSTIVRFCESVFSFSFWSLSNVSTFFSRFSESVFSFSFWIFSKVSTIVLESVFLFSISSWDLSKVSIFSRFCEIVFSFYIFF